ncbi:MAG: protease modulator HflC [Alphaproteobacteria bacterium]
MKNIKYLPAVILALLFLGYNSLFTVNQTEQVIVLQFGDPKRVVKQPGLNIKVPFIQNVVRYDNRVLDLDPPEFEVLLTDKKRINIDAFARYQIVDPLKFYQRVKREQNLRDVFGKSLNAGVRRVIATVSLSELLSEKRIDSMNKIAEEIRLQAESLGVKVIDVRIGRTNLPSTTAQAVYNRMRTEREREAREARAEGNEIAQKIRAKADFDRTVILADAERKAEILRGEGEAEKNKVLAKAYGKDPKFFEFYKSMQNYKQGLLGDGDTTIVISPDSEFFKYLKRSK